MKEKEPTYRICCYQKGKIQVLKKKLTEKQMFEELAKTNMYLKPWVTAE